MVPPIGFVVCIIIGIAALGGAWFLMWNDYEGFSKKWFSINRTIYDVILGILGLLIFAGGVVLFSMLCYNFLFFMISLWEYFREHTFLFKMFVTFLVFLAGYFILNKKLPEEKHLDEYKKGMITGIIAAQRIVDTTNKRRESKKIPSLMNSKLIAYKQNKFNKRVKADRDLLYNIMEFIKINEISKE